MSGRSGSCWLVLLGLVACPAFAGDWPMWRCDAGRSGVAPDGLPETLSLHWERQLPAPNPAWPSSQTKLQFDRSYQPVVLGQTMFVGSTINDSITAYETRTGAMRWRFFTEGPVRFAPVAADGKVYAVSDDGHLYCLNAETGTLLWKVNGGPAKRLIIGNDRLVSTWPARGGVVLDEGVLYFTASIWPSMGIFIHAVDAETGKVLWTNSETGSLYTVHPHGASAFGSIVPQGYLAVSGDYLVVPGGRSLPAVFDKKTGKLVHFNFGGKSSGGFEVLAAGDRFWVGGELFDLRNGKRLAGMDADLMTGQDCIAVTGGNLQFQSLEGDVNSETTTDRKGQKQEVITFIPKVKRSLPLASDISGTLFCQAGNRMYLGTKGQIAAVDVPQENSKSDLKAAWTIAFEETPTAILAADDRLFVVTENHKLYCYGPGTKTAVAHTLRDAVLPTRNDQWVEKAKPYIEASNTKAGYAVLLGISSRGLIDEIVRQTELQVIAVDREARNVDNLRIRTDLAGLYGTRVTALLESPESAPLPPYFADLIAIEGPRLTFNLVEAATLAQTYQLLRPYGGVLVFPANDVEHAQVQPLLKLRAQQFAGAKLERQGQLSLLRREGPLPDSGEWTHQYGDAANSVVSKDALVKAPLGVLWFGGPSNDKVLPRHGHGPSPQVAGGRLVIEGPDMLRAVDVYTGRVHWEKDLPGVGEYYNVTKHFSGASEVGSNYVTLADRVYVIHQNKILELDAKNGETLYAYQLPSEENAKTPASWGFLASDGGRLVATSSPVKVEGSGGSSKSATGTVAIPKGFTPIIKPNAEWSYLAGEDPEADWTRPGYAAKDWKAGNAGFGYGDDDDKTVLKDMRVRYSRVYLRKELDGGELKNLKEAALAINYDDAFIAYLNGQEILRQGVGKGQGKSASKLESHEAKGYETFPIADIQKLVQPGKNVLAIEGHNDGLTSSDFTLDPYLIASAESQSAPEEKPVAAKPIGELFQSADKASASRRLVVFDAKTRQELWSREAVFSFRHNAIAVTKDRVYCIDALTTDQIQQLKRRGLKNPGQARLFALDAQSGEEIWSTSQDVFGTFLNYSTEHDVLLQAGSAYRDRATDEVGEGMVAYNGTTGEVLWKDLKLAYNGPCLLWNDKIITNGTGGFQLDLLTGEKTGWKFSRMYGCNTVLGSEHLLTFRSGAAGFCDLTGDSGTGNLGGFRSSCTSNLIAADGVLNAPDYTRTCVCAYQNQTSVAWIHLPEADAWTFSALSETDDLKQIGLNLGAPGDRRSESGTLWFDYPSQGGPSPELDVATEPKNVQWFSRHPSTVTGEAAWITASGGEGLRKLTVDVPESLSTQAAWTVRLYFAEPETIEPADRVFSIALQNQIVAPEFDIAQEAGGPGKSLIKEFPGIKPARDLTVELTPTKGSTQEPILCGIEILPAKSSP